MNPRPAATSADPYLLLGLERSASLAQIRSAHRRLAKTSHPDLAGGDGGLFLAVQQAYQILTDPDARRAWDASHPAPRGQASSAARPIAWDWQRTDRPTPRQSAGSPWRAPGVAVVELTSEDEGYPYRTVAGAAWSHAGRAKIRSQYPDSSGRRDR